MKTSPARSAPVRLAVALATLAAIVCVAGLVPAATKGPPTPPEAPLRLDARHAGVLTGGLLPAAKSAVVDTVYLLGGPDRDDGDFQDAAGLPAWDGWSHVDLTAVTDTLWQVSTFRAANLDPATSPNHAWWCGTVFESCGAGDPPEGYGNGWDARLDWYGAVANPYVPVTVTVTAVLNYDNEPGYDYLRLQYEDEDGLWDQLTLNGQQDSLVVAETFSLTPADYVGEGGDQVHLRWRFESDSGWSDEDCNWPTAGAAQIDLLVVTFDQGAGPVVVGDEDNEGADNEWFETPRPGVGDFAQVWPRLDDLDPCRDNATPQVAFVDDGVVVPGTGGSPCQTWCYGPGGWVVNSEGGLAGPAYALHNLVVSPSRAWPGAGYDGAILRFDVYRHMDLSSWCQDIFYRWGVRSTSDPAGLDGWTEWRDHNFVYYGGPDYFRHQVDVSDILLPDRTFVQVAVGVWESNWIWCWGWLDVAPAPYFDNVAVLAYDYDGPFLSATEAHLAQDAFPASGDLDLAAPGANSVRFDMARSVAVSPPYANDPGDSLVAKVAPVRAGAVLAERPQLHYRLQANPLFDPYRTAGLPAEGWVYGDTVRNDLGQVVADHFAFDLPDSGFLYPGDVIHYFFRAQDNVGGEVGTALLPADTSGCADFSSASRFPGRFTMRALPSVRDLITGEQPRVLCWDDAALSGGREEWLFALRNLGYAPGVDYDLYTTNAPSGDAGDGLGGRATVPQLAGYETLLYSSGDLTQYTLSDGAGEHPSDDIGLLDAWLRLGGRSLLLTGNSLVADLNSHSQATRDFLAAWLDVAFVDRNLQRRIDDQVAPLVKAVPGNPVFTALDSWYAHGGCPRFQEFDAVTAGDSTQVLAEFCSPAGATGVYDYAAATLRYHPAHDARVLLLPYDLAHVRSLPSTTVKDAGPLAARARLLAEVLAYSGQAGTSLPTDVPGAGSFVLRNHPNPFNPRTTVSYHLPQRGHLAIQVYDLRGRLVRSLLDRMVAAGPGAVRWDGRDGDGAAVASGVYFCRARAAGQARVAKMLLVR